MQSYFIIILAFTKKIIGFLDNKNRKLFKIVFTDIEKNVQQHFYCSHRDVSDWDQQSALCCNCLIILSFFTDILLSTAMWIQECHSHRLKSKDTREQSKLMIEFGSYNNSLPCMCTREIEFDTVRRRRLGTYRSTNSFRSICH